MTEQEASKRFKERLEKHSHRNIVPEYLKAMEMAIKALEKQKDNGWIPCSKRLPKYDEEYFEKHNNNRQYIVMCKDSYAPTVAYFSKEKTWYYNDFVKFNDVIAWQPLPEPYKESEK